MARKASIGRMPLKNNKRLDWSSEGASVRFGHEVLAADEKLEMRCFHPSDTIFGVSYMTGAEHDMFLELHNLKRLFSNTLNKQKALNGIIV